jgi:hypothetical protein
MKVTLSLPWTDRDGKEHKQGATVDVDRATRYDLVFHGLARDAEDTKAAADGKVK